MVWQNFMHKIFNYSRQKNETHGVGCVYDTAEETEQQAESKTEFQQTADEIVADTPDAQLATEAAIMALTDSGIDVVEATDEMAMAVLNETQNTEFQVVYHGSGAKFDAFDHSHIGEGEGNQAYGWGTYVTEVEEIGKSYASTSIQFQGLTHELARLKERLPFLKGQVREEALDRKKRQAIREGGLILTLASAAANTPNHLSTDKVSDTSSNSQDNDILFRPETGLPNTNNALEGVFSDIKSKTRVHSGISRDNRKKLLDEYIKRKY